MSNYFPSVPNLTDGYPLQSKIFGHRFKGDQTLYEYILEFLLVVFSEKQINNEKTNELFPLTEEVYKNTIMYLPEGRIGLKRFILFNKSKEEGRFKIDQLAYDRCVEYVKDNIQIDSSKEYMNKEYAINMLQNLLYGFNAVIKNRSWFAQNFLPICKELIMPELMGQKSVRKKLKNIDFEEKVDTEFEKNRYNFMCRGGEVYYLHILKSINDYPDYKTDIESGLTKVVKSFKEFSLLCNAINTAWIEGSEAIQPEVRKTLGAIPEGFNSREENTLKEVSNILNSNMHSFEKIELLATGIIIQILVMCHNQSRFTSNMEKGFWLIDVKCNKSTSNKEVKKLAIECFNNYEQDIIRSLYLNVEGNIKEGKTEKETIDDAGKDSYKVYRKLGKEIGLIRPMKGTGMRFTLNEKILKFFVTSIVPPSKKLTLDRFLELLYEHFNIVIAKEQYKKLMEDKMAKALSDISFLDNNKMDFQNMLKECGFLRELSDSTSIVENPYLGG